MPVHTKNAGIGRNHSDELKFVNMKHDRPFEGMKVLELASVLAGPAVGMFFAELGAEVIKIENKRSGGDVTRNWKLPSEDPASRDSAYFRSVNWGKRCVMMDLTDERERHQLHRKIAEADVIITNFKKGSAEKLSLDYQTVSRINPKVIHANLTAYGESSDKVGYDVLLQAETGFLYMSGQPGGKPAKMPVALIDILAAHQLKEAILLALLERQRTGKGSYITVSLAHSAIAALANQASNYLNEGFIPQKMGSRHPNISPYGEIFTTSDGKEIILAIGSEEQFKNLCEILSVTHLYDDDRFSCNAARVTHRDELASALGPAIAQKEYAALLAELDAKHIPAGAIRDMSEVFRTEPGRDMILEYDDGARCVSTLAFRFIRSKVGSGEDSMHPD
jgi:crotonobetainyl-CoA:carnitine CoA-transferase CaiB-like acyl-CoA transferase